MAAQQNVKIKINSKKRQYSKKITGSKGIVEETAISGNISNSDSQSSIKKIENNPLCCNMSLKGLNNKKCNGGSREEAVLLKNDEDSDKSNRSIEKVFVHSSIENSNEQTQCVQKSTEMNSSTSSEKLSKAKKRRLRKRKLKLASVSPLSSKSLADSECSANIKGQNIIKKEDNISAKTERPCNYTESQGLTEIKKNTKNPDQYSTPSKNKNKNLKNNNNTLIHSPKDSFTANSNEPSVSNSNSIIHSSLNEMVHCDGTIDNVEEQKVTAHVFNDILLNIIQTLNTNDEIVPKPSYSSPSPHLHQTDSEVDKQDSVEVKMSSLESDLNIIDKIKEFSETFSKLESVEKLFNSSTLDKFSGDTDVDGGISKYKTEIKDLTSFLPVDDSSDMLQVNDKNNTVAERNSGKKEKNCILDQVNNKMDGNDDNVIKSASKSTKSREEILAEREAKKAAKLAAKQAKASGVKAVPDKVNDDVDGCITMKKPVFDVIEPVDGKSSRKNKVEKEKEFVGTVELNVKENQDPKQFASNDAESTGKTKAQVRAERREKQEAQRAAKASQKDAVKQTPKKEASAVENKTENSVDIIVKGNKKKETEDIFVRSKCKAKLFSHLYFEKYSIKNYDYCNIHPAILQLGAQYEARVISGSNARCLALLQTLKRLINDFSTPSKQEFSRGLESMLAESLDYLNYCRPSSVSMTNAVRHIKRHLTQLSNNVPDPEARQKLHDVIDTYVREQIDVAGEAICNTVQKKINDGDVILTYGCSSLIYRILLESHRSGTKFSVVVVDAGPWFEGREMLRRLVKEGLKCSYILITAASFIMREASKVLLGAHALLANGYVMSRAGSSQVALLAHSYNVPVLVCCETHKFSQRVQTDAFVYNELGNPDDFMPKTTGSLMDWRTCDFLTPLSIAFDVTPADFVTAVVTEVGILPCTSVPVILRIKPSETV